MNGRDNMVDISDDNVPHTSTSNTNIGISDNLRGSFVPVGTKYIPQPNRESLSRSLADHQGTISGIQNNGFNDGFNVTLPQNTSTISSIGDINTPPIGDDETRFRDTSTHRKKGRDTHQSKSSSGHLGQMHELGHVVDEAMNSNSLIIYTDGSSKNLLGGYGIVMIYPNGEVLDYCGSVPIADCTNNQAELYAIYASIVNSTHNKIIIRSDSIYSIKSLTIWIHTWMKNGWMTAKRTPVDNKDIILSCYNCIEEKKMEGWRITFQHVSAHVKYELNERADRLANIGREQNLS